MFKCRIGRRCGGGLAVEFGNQGGVVAIGFGAAGLQLGDDEFDPVDRRQHQRDMLRTGRGAVAQQRDHALRRMGQLREAGQAEKAAGAFDGMHETKDARDQPRIRRIALEQHELAARRLDMLGRFRQKILEKLVHVSDPGVPGARADRTIAGMG